MYAIMLLVGVIVCAITLAPGLQDWLKTVPFCANSTSATAKLVQYEYSYDCAAAIGYMAVYRICFALVCFFALMAAMMIGAKSSKDPRAAIQNGFWALKFMIVIGIAIGAFFIPAGNFGTAWMWIGLIGGFLFILVQLVYLIDFAHRWAESWTGNRRCVTFNYDQHHSTQPKKKKNLLPHIQTISANLIHAVGSPLC